MKVSSRLGQLTVRQLLASSSLAALLIGGGAPAAWAQCAINDVGVSTGAVTNSAAINCINIQNSTVTGNVTNTGSGTIAAGPAPPTNTGITINNSTIGGAIVNAGKITTTSGNGIIVSGSSAAVSGGVSNSGTISGTGNNAIVVVGVTTFSGGISNSGTIAWSGNGNGILLDDVSTFTGSISNTGMLSAAHFGVQLINLSAFTGGITNSGTLTGAAGGISISNVAQFGTSSAGISNSGIISGSGGGNGISLANVSSFYGGIVNANGGTISGFRAIEIINGSLFAGGINNRGTIIGVGSTAIRVSGISTFQGGIANSGMISGPTGIFIYNGSTFTGGIANSGTISATGSYGIAVVSVAQFGTSSAGGGITNSGTISGHTAIAVKTVTTFQGGIDNTGLLTAAFSGVAVNSVATFNGGISNSGTIAAGHSGILLNGVGAFSGGIANSGSIAAGLSGVGIGIYEVATVQGGITNTGTIAAGAGIQIIRTSGSTVSVSTFAGNIANSGTIIASVGAGIQISSVVQFGTSSAGGVTNSGLISGNYGITASSVTTFLGGITNSGTIAAHDSGISVAVRTFVGGISNSGSISAFSNNGISVNAAGATFGGGIANSGTITAGDVGLYAVGAETFAGGISNSGSIGAATGISVNLVTTFSGGIANSGTISAIINYGIAVVSVAQFGASSAGGGIVNSGAIVAGPTAILLRNVTTFAGGISNSGTISGGKGIRVGWASTFTIAGVSTFSGGITNTGLIAATNNEGITVEYASIFSGGITNAAGGTISAPSRGIAVSNLTTFSGNISNAGTITAATGIFIDAGVGFTAGGAIVNSGTIIGTASAINASQATSAVIIDINGGAISGDMIGAGTASGDTVNFALGSGSFTYASTISGMQAVNINSGTLFDGGSITAAGVVVNSGGTLAPGLPNTTGTLSITGNLTFNAGSGYEVMITNAGTNSSTGVTGATTINGGTAEVKPLQFGHYNATTYTLLTASGGVAVNTPFAGPVFVGPFAYTGSATLTYPTDQVDLVLGPGYVDFAAPPGAGQNQQNVVAGIDSYITSGGALPPGFANLGTLSGPAYLNALTQLDGEAATDAGKGANQLMTDFLNLMFDMSVEGRGGGGGAGGGASGFTDEEQASLPPDIALAYAQALHQKPKPQNFDQRWSAWGSAFGGTAKTDGDPVVGSNNVTASDYGFAGGMDYHVTPQTLFGFALAGGGTNWTVAQNLGGGRSDALQAGVYGITHAGPAYLSGALAFANHWFNTSRIALGDDLTAKFQGQSYAARGEVGYRYAVPLTGYVIGVTPYAALQAQDFHTPSYSETDLSGGGFGLTYNAVNATDTRSELGARFDNLTVWDGMPLVLRGRLAWAHDWVSNPTLGAVFQALPGSNFTVNGAAVPQNSALTTAAAELHLTANWTAMAKFDGDFASTSQTYAGTGTLKYSW